MSRLEERDYTYFTTVRGMCRSCRKMVPARVFFQDGKVWQQSLCPDCDSRKALIAGDTQWYLENALKAFPDQSPLKSARPPEKGCPHDCGPCTWHASPCQLPVVSITNNCNLSCPICFTYNRPGRIYDMPVDHLKKLLDWLSASSGQLDLINITGGEPTLHPRIREMLACCKRPGIGRVTMNTNGLRLAEDPALCEYLAEQEVCVVLSLNTLDPDVSRRLHGRDIVREKRGAIRNLARAGVRMTLLHVMVREVNENALAGILDLMDRHENILSLTVQTMTYTGQGGGEWPVRKHIPVDEAADRICAASKGRLARDDFMPRPSAHPLCYLVSYLLKSEGGLLPFTRFADRSKLLSLLKDSYLIRLNDNEAFFMDVINQLNAAGEKGYLKIFRSLFEKLYPKDRILSASERQRVAESSVRTVYVHAHMDEDNFDCSRAMMCPDLVPTEPGKLVPACTYNLFYRMKDPRFFGDSHEALSKRSHED